MVIYCVNLMSHKHTGEKRKEEVMPDFTLEPGEIEPERPVRPAPYTWSVAGYQTSPEFSLRIWLGKPTLAICTNSNSSNCRSREDRRGGRLPDCGRYNTRDSCGSKGSKAPWSEAYRVG